MAVRLTIVAACMSVPLWAYLCAPPAAADPRDDQFCTDVSQELTIRHSSQVMPNCYDLITIGLQQCIDLGHGVSVADIVDNSMATYRWRIEAAASVIVFAVNNYCPELKPKHWTPRQYV